MITHQEKQAIRERLEKMEYGYFDGPANRTDIRRLLADLDAVEADNAALLSIFDGVSNPRDFMLAVRQMIADYFEDSSGECLRSHMKKIAFLCTSKNSCTHCGGTGISSQEDLDGMTTHSGPCGYCLLGHPGTALLARHAEELAAKVSYIASLEASLTDAVEIAEKKQKELERVRSIIAFLDDYGSSYNISKAYAMKPQMAIPVLWQLNPANSTSMNERG